MKISVTHLTPEHTTIITSLVNNLLDTTEETSNANHIKQILADNRTHLFAALEGDTVIGYTLVYTFPSLYASGALAYLYDIEVLPGYRRKGAGRLLMETLLAHLKTKGVAELWLGTATDNADAQALFKATGGVSSAETFNDFTFDLRVGLVNGREQ